MNDAIQAGPREFPELIFACGRRDPIRALIVCDEAALEWFLTHLPKDDGCTAAIRKALFRRYDTEPHE